jgi:lipopolysaccharide transport system ATP-binding protein
MFSENFSIRVETLGKRYEIYAKPQDRLKQSLFPRFQHALRIPVKTYYQAYWALTDVSFEVKPGETIGIIGRNGSGKSTLLQMISGTLAPTTGHVETNGRIAALLELGSGFNPEFTGRENVYLNGSILGLPEEYIDSRFDDIASFANIGDFINQPVKMYSSGMYVRLAFAINVMIDPDILIVDEALAVGDVNFQAKCMTAMRRRQESGTTILFVSHDINSVRSLCSRALYLDQGKVNALGEAADITEYYLKTMREEMNKDFKNSSFTISKNNGSPAKGTGRKPFTSQKHSIPERLLSEFEQRTSQFRYGSGEARIIYMEMLNLRGEVVNFIDFNEKVTIRIFLRIFEKKTLTVNFNIADDKKISITGADFSITGQPFINAEPGDEYQVDYSLNLPLQEGNYSIRTSITEYIMHDEAVKFVDFVEDAFVFNMGRKKNGRVWSKVYLFPNIRVTSLNKND